MIPKVIHYCWFGGNPLPEDAKKYIESWKKYCPDYEIKEWNEQNFDLNICTYVKQAYEAKKWAFVSDYARFWILYNFGGLYFDTDVEIIKPIDDLINCNGFMGVEKGSTKIAPGLGIGFERKNNICGEIKNYYEKSKYVNDDGTENKMIVLNFATDILLKHGYDEMATGIQMIDGVSIYPPDYLCPIDYKTGVLEQTSNTYCIHWYSGSWISEDQRKCLEFEKKVSRLFGKKIGAIAERAYSFPIRVKNKYEKLGMKGTLFFVVKKFKRKNE